LPAFQFAVHVVEVSYIHYWSYTSSRLSLLLSEALVIQVSYNRY
jgi:hypothetical protein